MVKNCIAASTVSVGATTLYQSYRRWAESAGVSGMSQKAFGERVHGKGFERKKDRAGRSVYRGIGLLPDGFPGDPPPPAASQKGFVNDPPSSSVGGENDGGTEDDGGPYVKFPSIRAPAPALAQDERFTAEGPLSSVPPSSAQTPDDDEIVEREL